jgi:hypothetical protein
LLERPSVATAARSDSGEEGGETNSRSLPEEEVEEEEKEEDDERDEEEPAGDADDWYERRRACRAARAASSLLALYRLLASMPSGPSLRCASSSSSSSQLVVLPSARLPLLRLPCRPSLAVVRRLCFSPDVRLLRPGDLDRRVVGCGCWDAEAVEEEVVAEGTGNAGGDVGRLDPAVVGLEEGEDEGCVHCSSSASWLTEESSSSSAAESCRWCTRDGSMSISQPEDDVCTWMLMSRLSTEEAEPGAADDADKWDEADATDEATERLRLWDGCWRPPLVLAAAFSRERSRTCDELTPLVARVSSDAADSTGSVMRIDSVEERTSSLL